MATAVITWSPSAGSSGSVDNKGTSDENGFYAFRAESGAGSVSAASAAGVNLADAVSTTVTEEQIALVNFPGGFGGHVGFSQADIDLDGTVQNNSPWGYAQTVISSRSVVLYFNLVVNGAWSVQNLPISQQPEEQDGDDFTILIPFALGVESGSDVASMEAQLSVTEGPIASAPTGAVSLAVGARQFTIYGSILEGAGAASNRSRIFANFAKEEPLAPQGGQSKSISHPADFPNQEAPTHGACVKTAVSNSLTFLNERWKLGLSNSVTNIAGAKEMVMTPEGESSRHWSEHKDNYMKNQNPPIPITTRAATSWDEVYDLICQGMDVEIETTWFDKAKQRELSHCMAVVGITLGADGKVTVEVAHDGEQEKEGGILREPLNYDGTTATFTSGSMAGTTLTGVYVEIVNQ